MNVGANGLGAMVVKSHAPYPLDQGTLGEEYFQAQGPDPYLLECVP